jgi:hypothetical protein
MRGRYRRIPLLVLSEEVIFFTLIPDPSPSGEGSSLSQRERARVRENITLLKGG